jgi:hypothetical protein
MDYPGKVITKNQVTPTQISATGVWTLDDAAAATRNNNWPVAGVPNPISKSLRFNSADSAYLNRTPASAGNRKTWTWSGWVKRGTLSSGFPALFMGGATLSDTGGMGIAYGTDDKIYIQGYSTNWLVTTQVFRDPSAWYHIVVAMDSTNATANNRLRLYINGSEVTSFSTRNNLTQNTDYGINQAASHTIGYQSAAFGYSYFDGYMTEINFIDGQALTPSSFGMTDPVTGVWEPLKYSGTYGTNGFYLNFKDATSTTTLGLDYSGNSNTWTTNNFSVTAGAGNDSLTDVPTPWIVYNTTGDVGGVVRGNYCTLNPLFTNQTGVASNASGTAPTISNGNLTTTAVAGSAQTSSIGTMGVFSGKWYFEYTPTAVNGTGDIVGFVCVFDGNLRVAGYRSSGVIYRNGSTSSGYSTWTDNDVIGIALDIDGSTVSCYKNNTLQATLSLTNAITDNCFPLVWFRDASGAGSVNFGQRPFAYTPPSGFLSLCTTNLPASTIPNGAEYMAATTWISAGGTETITNTVNGVSCAPDLVWMKNRTISQNNYLVDSNRGISKILVSNTTSADATDATFVTALNSNGFSLGAGGFAATQSIVAWQWKANGAGVSNTAGSITSTVSANTTSGFSIVTYTGTGSAATIGHGLGAVPSMFIVKNRDAADAWQVYHAANTAAPETDYLVLNTTAATADAADRWNDTLPTSTVFSIGNGVEVNTNTEKYVAYCFAAISGFSAFGSYTGNGSADGPFVYLGFRPRYVLTKASSGTSAGSASWIVRDTSINPSNVATTHLRPNLSNAQDTGSGEYIDILSNGFKSRGTGSNINESGTTYIYACFAENPFKNALAR